MNSLLLQIKSDLENQIDKRDLQYVFIGNPKGLAKAIVEKGACVIEPHGTDFRPIATGVKFEDVKDFSLIFVKSVQDEFYGNAQKENATEWLMRVMEGRNPDGTLKATTGIYITLTNLRRWGKLQESVSTTYDTTDLPDVPGAVAIGTITVRQKDTYNLVIN